MVGDLKIELLSEGNLVQELTPGIHNNGEYSWLISDLPSQGWFELRLAHINDVFSGEHWESEPFIISEKWEDLGFVSAENAWLGPI